MRTPKEHPSSSTDRSSYAHGAALYRQGKYAAAAAELSALRGQNGALGRIARYYEGMSFRALGLDALSSGNFDLAEKHLRSAWGLLGSESDLAGYLAVLYAQTGRHGQCAAAVEQTPPVRKDDPQHYRKLAQAQWHAGNRQEAYLTLAEALRRVGPDGELLLQEGLFHAAEDNDAEARRAFRGSIEADCSNTDAHYYLGLVEAATGHLYAALTSLQRAFELRPSDVMLAYQLAMTARAAMEGGYRVFLRLPEPARPVTDSAARQLAAYITQEPDYVAAFLALPASDVDDDLFGTLADVIGIAVDEHRQYSDLNRYLAAVLSRIDRVAEAVQAAERAVDASPSYVQGLQQLARLRMRLGQDTKAVELFERAIAAGGDWPDIHYTVAELLHKQGRSQQAARHLKKALELNPKYADAKRTLSAMAA